VPAKNIALAPVCFIWFYIISYTDYTKARSFTTIAYFYKQMGLGLSKFSDKGYSLLIGEAGIIPYFSKWKSYDFIGLADRELATKKLSLKYFENKSPELIFLYSNSKDSMGILTTFYDQSVILQYMKNKNNYKLEGCLDNNVGYILVYMKNNIKDYAAIKEAIIRVSIESQKIAPYQYSKKNLKNWFTLKYIQ
jgi:hypothetical protein